MTNENIVAIFDCETTGVRVEKDGIVQLAAVLTDAATGKATTLFSSYCKPHCDIDPEAQKIHGISEKDLLWSPPQKWAVSNMMLAIQGAGVEILAGHNSERFDIPLIDNCCPGHNLAAYRHIDTYTMAMRMFPDKEQKLGPLYEWYIGEDAIDAHDAAADCWMVAKILAKMLADLNVTATEAAAWCATPVAMKIMPFGKYKGKPVESISKSYLRWCRDNFTEPHKDLTATFEAMLD